MKITVYSTMTCPYCVQLKSWLSAKGVEFEDVMVDKDPKAAQMMVEMSGQMGVPFSTIEYEGGGIEKILGFDRIRFEAALATQ